MGLPPQNLASSQDGQLQAPGWTGSRLGLRWTPERWYGEVGANTAFSNNDRISENPEFRGRRLTGRFPVVYRTTASAHCLPMPTK